MQSTAKPYKSEHFQAICQALLNRKQIELEYYSRQTDSCSNRTVSPQRLIYYRDNWYLDGWCHLRNGLRSFSIDAIREMKNLVEACEEIDDETLNRELESGYGIFSGVASNHAVLRFTPHVSRWVSREQWHPDQKGEFDNEGFYQLTVPYSQDTELMMDILRHGEDVEVIEPDILRTKVIEKISAMQASYAV